MFYIGAMQGSFDFGGGAELAWVRARLAADGPPLVECHRPAPLHQLAEAIISGRTRDAVAAAAFARLINRYPNWGQIAALPPAAVEAVIEDVSFAADKARHLTATLREIAAERPDFDLGFLAELPVSAALAWLERLPGVGRKVAAATLNFSTLRRPAFVVDSHGLRILRRFGFVGEKADLARACDFVMAAVPDWDADDLDHLHRLLKRHGQGRCKAGSVECGLCPLVRDCRAARKAGHKLRAKPVDHAPAAA